MVTKILPLEDIVKKLQWILFCYYPNLDWAETEVLELITKEIEFRDYITSLQALEIVKLKKELSECKKIGSAYITQEMEKEGY